MKEKEFDIKESIRQLGILLADETTGLIINTMKQDFYEKYKTFDILEAFDCLADEIKRLETVIELHDQLAICNEKDLRFLITQDPDDLDLGSRDEQWLKRLEERIRNQLLENWTLK